MAGSLISQNYQAIKNNPAFQNQQLSKNPNQLHPRLQGMAPTNKKSAQNGKNRIMNFISGGSGNSELKSSSNLKTSKNVSAMNFTHLPIFIFMRYMQNILFIMFIKQH